MTKAHKFDVDVAILGAGTAGMSAYREASKYTDRIALIDGGPLGTTCARVGCMPSKLLSGGGKLTAKTVIIATGSRPNIPKPFEAAGDRLIVNDDVFDWDDLPKSAAVFGAGVIGLELGQALHRLGVKVRLFGRDNLVGPLSDPAVRDYAARTFASEFPVHWHADTKIVRDGDQVVVRWSDKLEDEDGFDFLIAATGRRANLDKIGLENTSLRLNKHGIPDYDPILKSARHPMTTKGARASWVSIKDCCGSMARRKQDAFLAPK